MFRWRQVKSPLIFVIGFNKTATRAIDHLFAENGYPGSFFI